MHEYNKLNMSLQKKISEHGCTKKKNHNLNFYSLQN